jgi:hypothetical protein
MGYLQLFYAGQPNNRYPRRKRRVQRHDDLEFQRQFKSALRRFLPMTAIHTGPPRENWAGRKSALFGKPAVAQEDQFSCERERQTKYPAVTKAAWTVVVGFDESWKALYQVEGTKTVVVDWFGLTGQCSVDMVDKDNRQRLEIFRSRAPETSVPILTADRESLVEFFRSEVVATVSLNFEPDAAGLVRLCRVLSASGQSRIKLTGQFFGYPDWPDSTAAIALAFGTPDELCDDGRWTKLVNPRTLPVLAQRPEAKSTVLRQNAGILCMLRHTDDLQALMIAVRLYDIPFAAAVILEKAPTVDLLLEALNVIIVSLPSGSVTTVRGDIAICHACLQTPFQRTLYLELDSAWPEPTIVTQLFSVDGDRRLSVRETVETESAGEHFIWDTATGLPEIWLNNLEEAASVPQTKTTADVPSSGYHRLPRLPVSICLPAGESELMEAFAQSSLVGSGVACDYKDNFVTWASANSIPALASWGIPSECLSVVQCGPGNSITPTAALITWLRRAAAGQPAEHRFIVIHPGAFPVPGADLYKLHRPRTSAAMETGPTLNESGDAAQAGFCSTTVMVTAGFIMATSQLLLPGAGVPLPSWIQLAAEELNLPVCLYPAGSLGWRTFDPKSGEAPR